MNADHLQLRRPVRAIPNPHLERRKDDAYWEWARVAVSEGFCGDCGSRLTYLAASAESYAGEEDPYLGECHACHITWEGRLPSLGDWGWSGWCGCDRCVTQEADRAARGTPGDPPS